jgi:hypothetical protein
MDESFAARMHVAAAAAGAEGTDGVRLAGELRACLERAGYRCEEVFADDDGWCFFVAAERSPVCVALLRARPHAARPWQVTAQYEGGLSSIWSEQSAREGALLATHIQALLHEYLESLPSGPAAGGSPAP